jgi:ribose 5-phosphate isomerase A
MEKQMNQNELKQLVAQKAVAYVQQNVAAGQIIGVGTGSTANCFIDALATIKHHIKGAIASSDATQARLESHGIAVFDVNDVVSVPVYIDGADEIDPQGNMIKGGGAAHTREKVCASIAEQFVCIADESKMVAVLGAFPLPVEVIPLAREAVARHMSELGGQPVWRKKSDGAPLVTDNGCHILDVHGLHISEPLALEIELSMIPGVLTVGVFAQNPADLAFIATKTGVQEILY